MWNFSKIRLVFQTPNITLSATMTSVYLYKLLMLMFHAGPLSFSNTKFTFSATIIFCCLYNLLMLMFHTGRLVFQTPILFFATMFFCLFA